METPPDPPAPQSRTPTPPEPAARPSPEKFLELIARSRRGRLKIYLGHAAGTGKTVQMLREANELRARGTDVVGAYVETHGRPGTVAALGDLPLIPRRKVEYKGAVLEEMDLEAVLARAPAVAVVDELAHTNAPGSCHAKRWQDVDDLLDAGISVIAAVNIQHIESLNPVVERVTGVKVKETVPDSVLAAADQVVNLDISSDDLRERIRRGDVYGPEKIEAALGNFFTRANLGALRELALREAVRVLDQSRSGPAPGGTGTVPAGPAAHDPLDEADIDPVVMVAVSSRPPDVRGLLRKAAAIAHRLGTHWYLAYVETPAEAGDRIDAGTQRVLMGNISLAKDLGAAVVRLKGADVAATLAGFAREYGVTHAIFGPPPPPGPWWRRLARAAAGRGALPAEFHALAPEIDLHVCGARRG